jgi:hypothetical protein
MRPASSLLIRGREVSSYFHQGYEPAARLNNCTWDSRSIEPRVGRRRLSQGRGESSPLVQDSGQRPTEAPQARATIAISLIGRGARAAEEGCD